MRFCGCFFQSAGQTEVLYSSNIRPPAPIFNAYNSRERESESTKCLDSYGNRSWIKRVENKKL